MPGPLSYAREDLETLAEDPNTAASALVGSAEAHADEVGNTEQGFYTISADLEGPLRHALGLLTPEQRLDILASHEWWEAEAETE